MAQILVLLQLAVSLLVQSQSGTPEQQALALKIAQDAASLAQKYIVVSEVPKPDYQITIQPPILGEATTSPSSQIISIPIVEIQNPPVPVYIEPTPTQLSTPWDIDNYWQYRITFSSNEEKGGQNVLFQFHNGKNHENTINEVTLLGETKANHYGVEFQGIPAGTYEAQIKVTNPKRIPTYAIYPITVTVPE